VASMNACMFAVQRLYGRASASLPRARNFRVRNTRIESQIAAIKATLVYQQIQRQKSYAQQQQAHHRGRARSPSPTQQGGISRAQSPMQFSPSQHSPTGSPPRSSGKLFAFPGLNNGFDRINSEGRALTASTKDLSSKEHAEPGSAANTARKTVLFSKSSTSDTENKNSNNLQLTLPSSPPGTARLNTSRPGQPDRSDLGTARTPNLQPMPQLNILSQTVANDVRPGPIFVSTPQLQLQSEVQGETPATPASSSGRMLSSRGNIQHQIKSLARKQNLSHTVMIGGTLIPQPSEVAVVYHMPDELMQWLPKSLLKQIVQDEHDIHNPENKDLLKVLAVSKEGKRRGAMFGLHTSTNKQGDPLGVEQQLLEQADSATTTQEVETYPTFSFSWHSARMQQAKLPFHRRTHPALLCHLTRYLPRIEITRGKEGRVPDYDVSACFLRRFAKDYRRETVRQRIREYEAKIQEAKEKRAEAALKILRAQKFAGQNAIKQVRICIRSLSFAEF
jgi:hypothetical protein